MFGGLCTEGFTSSISDVIGNSYRGAVIQSRLLLHC